jgi:hypothetical protein
MHRDLSKRKTMPDDDNQGPPTINIEQMFAAMMPPSDPDSSFEASNADLQSITGWKKLHSIAVLSGRLTEPKRVAHRAD